MTGRPPAAAEVLGRFEPGGCAEGVRGVRHPRTAQKALKSLAATSPVVRLEPNPYNPSKPVRHPGAIRFPRQGGGHALAPTCVTRPYP